MYMAIAPSVQTFMLSILFGTALGIVWDIIKIIKKNIKSKNNKIFIFLDFAFFALACVFSITFFFLFTYGGFRIFVLAGEILGFIIYNLLITKFSYIIINLIVGFIIKILYNIFRLIRFIINKIIKFIIIIKLKIYNNFKKRKNKKKTCFYKVSKCIIKRASNFIKLRRGNVNEKKQNFTHKAN